jgi:DNA-binding IscR family transcriptional regulator
MTDDLERLERERRKNHALRQLINEMLQSVRQLHRNTTIWDAADRAQAEAELAEIMARVRLEAARGPQNEQSTSSATGSQPKSSGS